MPLRFDRFRFDHADRRLADDAGPVDLNPKAFDVLSVLVERRGQLVTKDELLDAVWADTHVTDGVLKVSIAELRRALGDSATAPRFIETVHRRGYRFIAPIAEAIETTAPAAGDAFRVWPVGDPASAPGRVGLVGREHALAQLERHLAKAIAGERQYVFVTGEAGAGKTALVEHFVRNLSPREPIMVSGSQCVEGLGSSEAYLPVLESVGRIARKWEPLRGLLRRYAPTWLAQLPWLVDDDDRDTLGRQMLGTARERMLREMAELVEALSEVMPGVLVFEDMHWCDPSTVDLVALVAGRRDPARFLIILTYRPAELVLQKHPLRAVAQRLVASGRATEIALDELPAEAVGDYLGRRFGGSRFSGELSRLVRKRTDGNPLFLVTLVDHLVARGMIVGREGQWEIAKEIRDELASVPESLRRLIEQQLERLDPSDRELVEAASLVGIEFAAAAAAAGADRDGADAEEHFVRLAATGPFVGAKGTVRWPDGTVSGAFAFRHALYREALAATVPARRRAGVHLRIATALERAYGEQAIQLAAELAHHYEEGGDLRKAIQHRQLAARVAATRHAFAEAESHLDHALALLAALPPSAERDGEELAVQSMIGAVRMATRGYAAPEVGEAYTRALALSNEATQGPAMFPILWGIWVFYAVGGELDRALELAERNRAIADASGDRLLRLEAHHALWTTHIFRGELDAAVRHLDQGEPLYQPEDRAAALVYGQDPKMAALGYRALVVWAQGGLDRAVELASAGLEHARALGHPMSVAQAMTFDAWVRLCREEADACYQQAEETVAYCAKYELPFWMPNGLQMLGWASIERGDVDAGMAHWERGIELWNMVRGSLGRTAYDAMFALAKARAGKLAEARAVLERCKRLVASSGERYHESEVRRIDAALLMMEAGGVEHASAEARGQARAQLQYAVECARRQRARTLELRALTALADFEALCGEPAKSARDQLTDLVATFTEGLDTADLRRARAALA